MDEDNSDDELPSISLSQDNNARSVAMPSASEVAELRERERRTELELLRLRALRSPPPTVPPAPGAPPAAAPCPLPRSDSSGSEGESALSAAVRALQVVSAPPAAARAPHPAPHAPVARRLLALLPLPPAAIQHYAAAFEENAPPHLLQKHIHRMVHSLSCAFACSVNAWRDEELVCAGGVLAAACLAPPAPPPAPPTAPPAARRALHRALQLAAPRPAVAPALAKLIVQAGAGPPAAPRALLALSDCLQGAPPPPAPAPPPPAARLAALLQRAALTMLLAPDTDPTEECTEPLSGAELAALLCGAGGAGGWRALDPRDKLAALRGAGRVLRACSTGAGGGAGGAGRALALLAQPAHHSDKHHPDYLKVVVAASTLQMLFRAHTA